jgi:HEAT repeat protein
VAELIDLLQQGDAAGRLRAARGLADAGPDASRAVGPLLLALPAGDAEFRGAALAALERLGPPGQGDVEALTALAADAGFPDGRRYALDRLAALGPDARPAALKLCAALKDPDPDVRCRAAVALGRVGPAARPVAAEDLLDALHDPDPAAADAAADALAALAAPQDLSLGVTRMLGLLRDSSAAARRCALRVLTAFGPAAREAAGRIGAVATGDAEPELRRLALAALKRVDPADLGPFTAAVADADPAVRLAAVEVLVEAGVGRGALPGLLRALAGDDDLAAKAQQAIRKAQLSDDQIRALGEALRGPDDAARARVFTLLEAMDRRAAPAVPGLRALIRGGPGEARRRAVDLAARIGRPAEGAADDLAALLRDADPAVRLDAACALTEVGERPTDTVPVLIAALRGERADDSAVRDRASQALARVGKPAVRPLVAALTATFADRGDAAARATAAAARLAVVETLGRIGPDARIPEVLAALKAASTGDASFPVRDAADRARRDIGE